MDQFSHDLTLALEETSLMVRACGVSRWGTRRRTRSTGNLPCAPQPTEDSSSSPTDIIGNAHNHHHAAAAGGVGASALTTTHANKSNKCNINDGLAMHINPMLPASDDSDEKHQSALPLRLPCKSLNAAVRLGTLESDSLNETNFSPTRFYKPCSRRKRKMKRMSMEFDLLTNSSKVPNPNMPHSYTDTSSAAKVIAVAGAMQSHALRANPARLPLEGGRHGNTADAMLISSTGTVRKRLLKHDAANARELSCGAAGSGANRLHHNLVFCGKRKRSNRDRYQEHHDHYGMSGAARQAAHYHQVSLSMPRHYANLDDYRMRPRSFSSTSKPHSERLLPLNKGLVSKIERISQLQKTDSANKKCYVKPKMKTKPKPDIIMTAAVGATTTANIQRDDDDDEEGEREEATGGNALNIVDKLVPISIADIEDDDDNRIDDESAYLKNPAGQQQDQEIMLEQPNDQELQQPYLGYYRKKVTHHQKSSGGNAGNHSVAAAGTGTSAVAAKSVRNRTRRDEKLNFGFLAEDLKQAMDCSDLNDFLSSSSLSSSSDSEDDNDNHHHHHHRRPNDTDREGDDELTDWPGNYEFGGGGGVGSGFGVGGLHFKYDHKRKLTKKSTLPQIRSDDTLGEDDTLMSGPEVGTNASTLMGSSTIDVLPASNISSSPFDIATTPTAAAMTTAAAMMSTQAETIPTTPTPRFQASEPIRIANQGNANYRIVPNNNDDDDDDAMSYDMICGGADGEPIIKQIESEMSGETSNPFLSSSPVLTTEVREIRAGCRRIKAERPSFSIKLGVNERLARFLQDPRQTQIRLPDIETYEQESLLSLANLYSLEMTLENGCAVLSKTSNTTQTVSIDQRHNCQNLFFSDFKRRCYDDGKGNDFQPRK